jgi:hypothetical protein
MATGVIGARTDVVAVKGCARAFKLCSSVNAPCLVVVVTQLCDR